MPNRTIVTLAEAVDAYMAVGRERGFAHAEAILMTHLPRHNPDGKVHDLARNRRRAFVADCREALAEARRAQRVPADG